MRTSRLPIALSIILLPGLILAPVWICGALTAREDDILYYYPSRFFFHQTIHNGQWPWMNPLTGLARPFAADPQSAVWYPPTWLFAAAPPPIAYPMSLWLHYSLAIWGMYRLMRSQRLRRQAALFGGIAFAFCGFMLAHRAHFSMQNAAAWVPWVLWRLQRYANAGGGRRLAFAAVAAALQCLAGHVQIAAMTALGSLVYVLCIAKPPRALVRWTAAWVAAAGLYAIQWLPTLAYVVHCTRVDNNYWDFTQNSWSPFSAIGLLMPMLLGQRNPNWFGQPWWGPSHQVEQFVYAGIIPLLLAACVIRRGCRHDCRRWGFLMLGLFGVLLALGKYGPICPLLYWVPGSSLFRVPARAMLLANLAIAGLAAFALHDLCERVSPARVRLRATVIDSTRRPLRLTLAVVLAVCAGIVVSLPFLDRATRAAALRAIHPFNPAVWVPLLMILVSLYLVKRLSHRWRQLGPVWPVMALTLLDLGVIGWSLDVPTLSADTREWLNPPARQQWAKHVTADSTRLWVVTDTAGVYGDAIAKAAANTNILLGVASLTDYGPLQPASIWREFRFAAWGVSEISPQLLTDTSWMGPFNIGWILVCDPELPAPSGCEWVTTTEKGFRLFRNPAAIGEAFATNGVAMRPVEIVRRSPQDLLTRLDVSEAGQASEARRLVLSRVHIPGWTARARGQELPIETVHGALMSVRVPRGVSEVEWSYRPPMQRLGAAISIISAVALLPALLLGKTRRPG